MKLNITKKNTQSARQGFTLVELLLVMAIIGILAGVIMIGLSSSRKKAKVTAALETVNSVKSELADCYLNNKTVSTPSAGVKICPGAGSWPDLSKTRCTYGDYNSGTHVLTIDCSINNSATITCDIEYGKCGVAYPSS